MEENIKIEENIVHLSRIALSGRTQDIQLYVRRLARQFQKDRPELAGKLEKLIAESPTRGSSLRDAQPAAIPVDLDSRLQLLRVEHPTGLDVPPILATATRSSLEQVVTERRHEAQLQRAGLLPTRSLLFVGPPGVGKTHTARWIAVQLGRPLLILDLSSVMSSFLGRTGANVRHVLDYAKSVECVLLLDELDAIAKRRDDAAEVGELKRLVTVLLQEIDEWPPTSLLVAATNHPELLDPAVWRRFDMVLAFPMPTAEQGREAVDRFLGPEKVGSDLVAATAIALGELSFGEIERSLLQIRRAAVTKGEPVGTLIEQLIKDRCASASLKDRKRIALELSAAGLTQRRVHELTGVSRDTIRKVGGSTS